jgi:hypothetical protein
VTLTFDFDIGLGHAVSGGYIQIKIFVKTTYVFKEEVPVVALLV